MATDWCVLYGWFLCLGRDLIPRRWLQWDMVDGGRAVAASPETPVRFLETAGPSPVEGGHGLVSRRVSIVPGVSGEGSWRGAVAHETSQAEEQVRGSRGVL